MAPGAFGAMFSEVVTAKKALWIARNAHFKILRLCIIPVTQNDDAGYKKGSVLCCRPTVPIETHLNPSPGMCLQGCALVARRLI